MSGMEKESKSALHGLEGLRVLSLESRRAAEMAKLIAAYGGEAVVAPSMREAPLGSNTEALAFARTLGDGGFDVVIFLTGVGTRALTRVVESVYPRERFVELLGEGSAWWLSRGRSRWRRWASWGFRLR